MLKVVGDIAGIDFAAGHARDLHVLHSLALFLVRQRPNELHRAEHARERKSQRPHDDRGAEPGPRRVRRRRRAQRHKLRLPAARDALPEMGRGAHLRALTVLRARRDPWRLVQALPVHLAPVALEVERQRAEEDRARGVVVDAVEAAARAAPGVAHGAHVHNVALAVLKHEVHRLEPVRLAARAEDVYPRLVGVAHEEKLLAASLPGRHRVLCVEDVVERGGVGEVAVGAGEAGALAHRRKRPQPVHRLGGEARTVGGYDACGDRREVIHRHHAAHGGVVVAEEADMRAVMHELERGDGVWAVSENVP